MVLRVFNLSDIGNRYLKFKSIWEIDIEEFGNKEEIFKVEKSRENNDKNECLWRLRSGVRSIIRIFVCFRIFKVLFIYFIIMIVYDYSVRGG